MWTCSEMWTCGHVDMCGHADMGTYEYINTNTQTHKHTNTHDCVHACMRIYLLKITHYGAFKTATIRLYIYIYI